MIYYVYIFTIVFIIINISPSAQDSGKAVDYPCKSHDDCKSGKQMSIESCALCADSSYGKGRCVFPFPYMFQTGNLHCDRLDPCPIQCFKDRGTCTILTNKNIKVYVPACACYGRFYGHNCQYEATPSQNPVYYVTWLFKGVIPVGDTTELSFAFFNHEIRDYRDTLLVLNTSDGFYEKKTGWSAIQGKCYFQSKDCVTLRLNVKFPYKRFSPTEKDQFITLKNQVVGYYSNFSIEIIDLGRIVFKNQFKIVVSYEQKLLKCIASIELRNCAPNPDSPTIFTRPSGIDFVSHVIYVSDGGYINSSAVVDEECFNGNTFIWKMWSSNNAEESKTPLFENYRYTKQAWHFNPYSLELGMYKVLYLVQHVKSNIKNFAYCYFKVAALPLIIRVEGGTDRLINKSKGLILSAALSSDPNMPASQQQDLMIEWSCKTNRSTTDIDHVCRSTVMSAARPYFIPPEKLTYSTVYNFTLKLWSLKYTHCDYCNVVPQRTFVRIEVGDESSNSSISIKCVENCNDIVNPNEPLFLKVASENINLTATTFEWTYTTSSVTEQFPDTFRVKGMPSFMLLLNEGFLHSGVAYSITVKGHSKETYARYGFITDSLEYNENCTVEPQKGTRGLTEFDIICPLHHAYALLFEFFDKSYEDTMSKLSFNGRMLGTTSTGQLQEIQLSRGYVTVFISNPRGALVKQEIKVELSPLDLIDDLISNLKHNLTESLIHLSDERQVIRLASLITDIIESKNENDFKFLLESLSKVTIDTFSRIKLLASTLNVVLNGFSSQIQLELQTDPLVDTLDFMDQLINGYRQNILNRGSSSYTPTKIVKEISKIVLQCSSIIINCKGNDTIDIEADTTDDLTLSDIDSLKYGTFVIEDIVNNMKDVLTFIQYSGKPPLEISTDNNEMRIWAITNDVNHPLTHFINTNEDIPVKMSTGLMQSITKKLHNQIDLSVQCANIGGSKFTWFKTDIKSNFVSVSLALKASEKDLKYIKTLQQPLIIRMTMDDGLLSMKVADRTTQTDPTFQIDYLDDQVKIHRLDIRPRSLMTIVFLYPPTNGPLRVVVMEEYRPDYHHMIENSISISNESFTFPHRYHEYDEPRFLYMGIIPGEDVPINQTVSYSFEVNTTLCMYWSRNLWKSDGCLVHDNTQGKTLSCQCTHLSTFGTAFLVPPQQVDPFGDAKLFLTVLDNPLVVSLVVAFLIVYVILCVLLSLQDRRDEIRKHVTVLSDNFPYDSCPYLLAVFTSPRLTAGTTANVGLKLIGAEAESRAHILKSSERRVLKTGSDDWFLIYCPNNLGKLLYLHMWHDNTGWGPGWYCEQVFVYDLINKTETKFIVEEWIALYSMARTDDLCYPEAMVTPTEEEDISSVKRNFIDNIVLGIREGHGLLRVFYRHPRSQVTRLQRLSIIMLYIMVSMLCSIMFYVPANDAKIGVDDYRYSVGTKELVISIQCLIISAVLTFIVLFAFRRSHKFYNVEGRSSIQSYSRAKNQRTMYPNFMLHIATLMKNPPLDPVRTPNAPMDIKKRTFWYLFAWISCITIIVICSYFVMLYGLKIGPVNSKKWLTSVFLAVGEDTFITTPAKIILFSLALSITFQLIVDVNTYKISIDDVIYKKQSDSENTDVNDLMIMRNDSMYAPMSVKTRLLIIEDKKILSNWWSFLKFLTTLAFVLVTCNVMYILWTSHYYTNNHIRTMIANTKFPVTYSSSFYKVSNITQLEHYMRQTLINAIYSTRWYNGRLYKERSFGRFSYRTSDCTNKLVGRPKIRQLRTVSLPCSSTVLPKRLCNTEWKKGSEDNNVYSKGWKPASYIDVQNNDSQWIYRERSSLFLPFVIRLYGSSGRLFHDGGYSVTLGPTRSDAQLTLDELQGDRWQDEDSRVVFVELTTFNGNQAVFSQVTLAVEYIVTGTVLLKAQVISASGSFKVNLWNILFVVFLTFYIIKTVYLITYYGLLDYLSSSFYNITMLLDIVLGIIAITLFCIHFYIASNYTNELQKTDYDKYFEFDSYFQYLLLLKIVLSMSISVSLIRMIGSIRGGKSLVIYFHTFILSIRFLFCISIVCLLVFLVLKQWTLIFNFTTFSFKEIFVNSKSLVSVVHQQYKNTGIKIFIMFNRFFIYVINMLLLLILIYSTRLSKTHVFGIGETFNFVTFILSRCVNRWNKIIARYIYKEEKS